MKWLYRLQQRLAITRGECMAVLAVAGLLLLGLAARHAQQQERSLPPEALSEEPAPAAGLDSGGAAAGAPQAVGAASALQVDINTATAAALQRLPHVGPVLSQRIVAYREQHGPFEHVQHLDRVRGIGPKTMEHLAPLVTVGAASSMPEP